MSKNDWKKVKIPELVWFQEGPGVRKYQFKETGIKLVNGSNINSNKIDLSNTKTFVSVEEASTKYKHFLVDPGDLIIASSGITVDSFYKKIAFIEGKHLPLCMNTSTIRFKTKDAKKLDVKFFSYYLRSNLFLNQLRRLITGSAQLNFGPSHLNQIDIYVPSIEIQSRIVRNLDEAYSVIENRKETINLLDEYLKSVFLDMFGDPVLNTKGWKLKKFSELGSLDRGKSKHRPRNAPELLGGIHPLIQTGDISNAGTYIKLFSSTYSDIGLAQSKKWPKETLCITIAANIAKTSILTFEACFPDSIVGFIPNNELTNNVFILFWLAFFQKSLEDLAPESAQKNINLEILRNLNVITPPIGLQLRFKEIVNSIEKVRDTMERQHDSLNAHLVAVQQNYFSQHNKNE